MVAGLRFYCSICRRVIPGMRYPSPVLKVVLSGLESAAMGGHLLKFARHYNNMYKVCDLLIPANAMLQSQSNRDFQVREMFRKVAHLFYRQLIHLTYEESSPELPKS